MAKGRTSFQPLAKLEYGRPASQQRCCGAAICDIGGFLSAPGISSKLMKINESVSQGKGSTSSFDPWAREGTTERKMLLGKSFSPP